MWKIQEIWIYQDHRLSDRLSGIGGHVLITKLRKCMDEGWANKILCTGKTIYQNWKSVYMQFLASIESQIQICMQTFFSGSIGKNRLWRENACTCSSVHIWKFSHWKVMPRGLALTVATQNMASRVIPVMIQSIIKIIPYTYRSIYPFILLYLG